MHSDQIWQFSKFLVGSYAHTSFKFLKMLLFESKHYNLWTNCIVLYMVRSVSLSSVKYRLNVWKILIFGIFSSYGNFRFFTKLSDLSFVYWFGKISACWFQKYIKCFICCPFNNVIHHRVLQNYEPSLLASSGFWWITLLKWTTDKTIYIFLKSASRDLSKSVNETEIG